MNNARWCFVFSVVIFLFFCFFHCLFMVGLILFLLYGKFPPRLSRQDTVVDASGNVFVMERPAGLTTSAHHHPAADLQEAHRTIARLTERNRSQTHLIQVWKLRLKQQVRRFPNAMFANRQLPSAVRFMRNELLPSFSNPLVPYNRRHRMICCSNCTESGRSRCVC